MLLRYTDQTMAQILYEVRRDLEDLSAGEVLSFVVADPDLSASHYDGEPIQVGDERCLYRSYTPWFNLAESLHCSLCTPVKLKPGYVQLGLRKWNSDHSWHTQSAPSGDPEKYGVESEFSRISKLEDPSFLVSFLESLRFVRLPASPRILSLGVNKGDELAMISEHCAAMGSAPRFVGIDHCPSAVEYARQNHSDPAFEFHVADLNDFETSDFGRFDLVVAINTLHSPNLDGQGVFRRIVATHLTPSGGLILGFPNCRYVDHALCYGAKVKNYHRPELSVLFKEAGYYKRYLHQHKFSVTLTGKHTVLLTGRRLIAAER